jgi:DNA-binding MarR family transcriptional regulator
VRSVSNLVNGKAMHPSIGALKRAYHAARKELDDQLAPHGLTSAHLFILDHLLAQGPTEQRRLQDLVGVTSASLTRVLDVMVERGLVERRPSEEDARMNWVVPSERGLELRERLLQIQADFSRQFLKGFNPAEATLLADWLTRVARNLDQPPTTI